MHSTVSIRFGIIWNVCNTEHWNRNVCSDQSTGIGMCAIQRTGIGMCAVIRALELEYVQ